MFVRFAPRDGDVQQWDFDPDDVLQSQAEMVEKRYGARWEEFLDGVRGGEAKARRVLVWHLMRLTHHALRFEDTPDFRMGELAVEFSSSELRELIAKVDRMDTVEVPPEVRSRLQQELTDAILREHGEATDPADVAAGEPEGKAS